MLHFEKEVLVYFGSFIFNSHTVYLKAFEVTSTVKCAPGHMGINSYPKYHSSNLEYLVKS